MRVILIVLSVAAMPALAQYNATVKLDEQGNPHIKGNTILHVAYGSGRQQMRDFPILTSYLIASASETLAELSPRAQWCRSTRR